MDKRLRWFDDGAPMLRHVLGRLGRGDALPPTGDYYACPCCLVVYSREAVTARILTEEHVPPERLGGHGLLLTCRRCNKEAGRHFDAHAITGADADDFARGKPTLRPLSTTVYTDGIPLRGEARWNEDGIRFCGVPKQNNPKEQAAHLRALDAYADGGNPNPNVSFTVHTRYNETRARYSWIRSAYLAAFAALGWTYILRPVMQPVRDQLKNPDAKILPTYMFRDPTASSTDRRMLLVDDPDELRCLAVMIGEHAIFMPGLWNPMPWDDLAEAFKRRRTAGNRLNVNLNGKEVPWPTRPTYFLDRPSN